MNTLTDVTSIAKNWISVSFEAGLVSVVIPSYNRSELLKEAVLSVFQQNHRPLECLIIDDGSTDDTDRVVDELRATLDSDQFKIIYITQANQGAPTARNSGVIHSKGEFIQFLDSDDLLYSDKLSKHVEYLQLHQMADGVFGDWDHGTIHDHHAIQGERIDNLIDQFYGGRVIHTLSFLFRRGIVARTGPWDVELKRNQEIDFQLRGALLGANFEYLPGPTGLWRVHDGERIVTSSGSIRALEFHDKWVVEFERLGLLDSNRRKTAAAFIFWYAMELGPELHRSKLLYLQKAEQLHPEMAEFNTRKMKWLRRLCGVRSAIYLWNAYGSLRRSCCKNYR